MDINRSELTGTVAVVTGATRNLGLAIAEGLAEAGARVVCVARTPGQVDELADRFPGRVSYERCDTTDPDQVDAMVDHIERTVGSPSVLVCNAGVHRDGRLDRLPKSEWDQVLDTNLSGTVNCLRAVLPGMRARRHGRVVTISSILGRRVMPGAAAYCASKAALDMVTRCAAIENGAHGVRVNGVSPGYLATGMGKEVAANDTLREQVSGALAMRRFGDAAEVVDCVTFLVSDRASYINGEIIEVSGGVRDL